MSSVYFFRFGAPVAYIKIGFFFGYQVNGFFRGIFIYLQGRKKCLSFEKKKFILLGV